MKLRILFATQWESVTISLIVLFSACMELFLALHNSYGNTYYAAAVQSMRKNWHNFFFVSYDPAGFLSVDKPPLALWIQTSFTKIFGYYGWSLMLPQVLAQVGSVWFLYKIVRQSMNAAASLLSAFSLAITPVSLVIGSTE